MSGKGGAELLRKAICRWRVGHQSTGVRAVMLVWDPTNNLQLRMGTRQREQPAETLTWFCWRLTKAGVIFPHRLDLGTRNTEREAFIWPERQTRDNLAEREPKNRGVQRQLCSGTTGQIHKSFPKEIRTLDVGRPMLKRLLKITRNEKAFCVLE
ncbi:hypothetical protein SRHO_G00276040 [Serrasalmus rhombeus]